MDFESHAALCASGPSLLFQLKERRTVWLLNLLGLQFPGIDKPLDFVDFTACSWSVLSTLILVGGTIGTVIDLSFKQRTFTVLINSVVFLQFLSMTTALVSVYHRMKTSASELELDIYSSSVFITSSFLVVTLLLSFIEVVLFIAVFNEVLLGVVLLMAEISVTCFMSACLMFVIVDSDICCSLIQSLHDKVENSELSLDFVVETRDKVKAIVKKTFYVNCFIILVAIVNAVFVIVGVFIISDWPMVIDVIGVICLFVREIIYLFIAIWKVSQVNELADSLTRKVADGKWGSREVERLSVYVSLNSTKISFPLAWRRLTKMDVMYGIGGVVVSFVIGIIKYIVEIRVM